MPNEVPVNPLAALFSSVRAMGEQANVSIKGLGDGLAQGVNQLLATAAQAAPPLPGLPMGQGNPGPRGNPNGGNPNGGKLPSLIPTAALQAIKQVEDVVLPKGFTGPAAALLVATGAQPAPAREPLRQPAAAPPPTPQRAVAARMTEMRGV